jgi:hypothetical protein
MNRRDLLTAGPLGAISLPLWGSLALTDLRTALASAGNLRQDAAQASADQDTFQFWASDVRTPEEPRARSISPSAPARPAFFFYDSKSDTFRYGSEIGDDGLPEKGSSSIILKVERIRPSAADQARIENIEGGSLRIDLQQTQPLPQLAERLAWTVIAGLLPENKSLPALADMNFNPGTAWGDLSRIPLPGGGGKWTWNFFLKKKKSRWMQVVDVMRRSTNLVAPIFGIGLPAIAATALDTVDKMIGAVASQDQTEWLFQSRDVYFYTTKSARDAFEGLKLRLRHGFYLVLPETKAASFDQEAKQLTLVEGLVVPKGTRPPQAIEASKEVLKEITYLSVGVTTKVG